MDSNIISATNKKKLISLCEFSDKTLFKLIYRASRDGFEAKNFHKKCDSIGNTLVVIKSSENTIFGGFTKVKWSSSYGWESDITSFIFSLINKENLPLKINNINGRNATFHCDQAGPCFGCANDIFISDKSNQNNNSYTNIGSSFGHYSMPFGSDKAMTFLTGSFYNFQTVEVEVFKLEDFELDQWTHHCMRLENKMNSKEK